MSCSACLLTQCRQLPDKTDKTPLTVCQRSANVLRSVLSVLSVFCQCFVSFRSRSRIGPVPVEHRATRPGFVSFVSFVTGQKPQPQPVEVYAAALVVPSARLRRRANRGTLRGLSQALRQSRVSAWFPVRRCPQRYGSNPQPLPAQAPTARERCESPSVARPHLRSASRLWAGWRPLRCRMPGMQATARERCESPSVARPHLRSARRLWAGWRPLRCRMPGMQATARAHRLSARRYRVLDDSPVCARYEAQRYRH